MNEGSTHFGFREVASAQKADKVGEVFTSVAGRYDLMNDLMSLGSHRLWKDFAVARSGVRVGHHVLDVAAGSGDMTRRFAKYVGTSGRVVMTDINQSMLECVVVHGCSTKVSAPISICYSPMPKRCLSHRIGLTV